MKPLILSFFAVILGFSLFIDKDENTTPAPVKKTIQIQPADVSQHISDSIPLFAKKSIKAD